MEATSALSDVRAKLLQARALIDEAFAELEGLISVRQPVAVETPKPNGCYRSLLNQKAQVAGIHIDIVAQPAVGGYVVTVNNEQFGPYVVNRKKKAIECASRDYLFKHCLLVDEKRVENPGDDSNQSRYSSVSL